MLALKSILLMIAGFVILIKGADFFVDGADTVPYIFVTLQYFVCMTI